MLPILLPLGLLACLTWLLTKYLQRSRKLQTQKAIADQHGCLPAPRLPNQRPFGIDRLQQIFRADAESRLNEYFLSNFRQMGNTLERSFLGTSVWGTIEPANLEAVLSTKFKDFSIGPRRAITFDMFGDGIFNQDDAAWKSSRDMLRPHLHHKHYQSLDIFQAAVDDLISIIEASTGTLDLQPLFFRLTLDTTTAFLFGESVKSLVTPDSGESTFASAFDAGQKWVTKRFRLAGLYWLVNGKEWRQACKDVHEFADQLIDRNLALKKAGEEGFLHSIAEHSPNRTALRGQIINLLVAGRDTTACLLSWTFFLLVRHPLVLEELRAEIAAKCRDGEALSRADLLKLPYLQNVLKEVLRLYPPVPINTRTTIRDIVLPTGGGPTLTSPILIPAGSEVAWSAYALHRRADLYGVDAEIFRPGRWDEDMPIKNDPVSMKWGYLPFHGGPRVCLGMDFALAEAGYTVVRLLQRFQSIGLPEGEKVEVTGREKQAVTLVISIKDGCKVEMR